MLAKLRPKDLKLTVSRERARFSVHPQASTTLRIDVLSMVDMALGSPSGEKFRVRIRKEKAGPNLSSLRRQEEIGLPEVNSPTLTDCTFVSPVDEARTSHSYTV